MILKKLEKINVDKEKDVVRDNAREEKPKKEVGLKKMNVDVSERESLLNYDFKKISLKKLTRINKEEQKQKDVVKEKPKETKSEPQKKHTKPQDNQTKETKQQKPQKQKKQKQKTKQPQQKKAKKQKKNKKAKRKSRKQINVEKSETIDDMILKLSEKTKLVSEDDSPFIETFSFLEDVPKIKKIKYKGYEVENLYSKIDEVKKDKQKIKDKQKKKSLIEEIDVPDVVSLKDDIDDFVDYDGEEFVSYEDKEDDHANLPKKETKPQPIPILVETTKGLDVNPVVSEKIKNIDNKKPKKQSVYEYIKPIDGDAPKEKEKPFMTSKHANVVSEKKIDNEFSRLLYTDEINITKKDLSNIYEKYSINDFTFVTVSYKQDKLEYNIVQPELNKQQEKVYSEIKNIFIDSIDQNYFSFKGDSQEIKNYLEKIYDLSVDKLSYSISPLDKKLYFLFVENDFSGLGFLGNVLRDRNILEVSCKGAETPITVYHIKYGVIETNLFFKNVPKLNVFVLGLTKLMGQHVNTNNPIIDGYLPNGYKVEGLYSVGDVSSKGSSFIVKKFLEKPICPTTLVDQGIGTPDIYSYIWSAISNDYHLIITGDCDMSMMLNAIVLFYPNKEIITVQAYDNLKLPQKNWIKRKAEKTSVVESKTILTQSISEKPTYLIVDNFVEEFFDTKWYNIDLLTTDLKNLPSFIEKIKLIGQKTMVINLKRITVNKQESIQIKDIKEYVNGKEYRTVNLNKDKGSYRIDLLSSNIDVVDYKNKKQVFYWLLKTNINDFRDFNNIIDDYYKDSKKLIEKLNINKEET